MATLTGISLSVPISISGSLIKARRELQTDAAIGANLRLPWCGRIAAAFDNRNPKELDGAVACGDEPQARCAREMGNAGFENNAGGGGSRHQGC